MTDWWNPEPTKEGIRAFYDWMLGVLESKKVVENS